MTQDLNLDRHTSWAEVSDGETLLSVTVGPISRTDIVRYAGAGGDFNRNHHDEPYAIANGYKSVFAMGLYPAGILAQQLALVFGLNRLRMFSVRFNSLVWPGETLKFSARVVKNVLDGDERIFHLETEVVSSKGDVKLSGKAIVAVEE